MPCSDGPPDYFFEAEKHRKKLDRYAQMLCGLCTRIEELASQVDDNATIANKERLLDLIDETPKLPEWWAAHKLQDAERVAAEEAERDRRKLRLRTLRKLSDEELDALGLERPKPRVRGKKKRKAT